MDKDMKLIISLSLLVLLLLYIYYPNLKNFFKNKIQIKTDEEYKKGIQRIMNFLKFAKSFNNNSGQLKQDLESIEATNLILKMSPNNSVNIDRLLKIDMICRRIFSQEYGGSDFKFNTKFNPK